MLGEKLEDSLEILLGPKGRPSVPGFEDVQTHPIRSLHFFDAIVKPMTLSHRDSAITVSVLNQKGRIVLSHVGDGAGLGRQIRPFLW